MLISIRCQDTSPIMSLWTSLVLRLFNHVLACSHLESDLNSLRNCAQILILTRFSNERQVTWGSTKIDHRKRTNAFFLITFSALCTIRTICVNQVFQRDKSPKRINNLKNTNLHLMLSENDTWNGLVTNKIDFSDKSCVIWTRQDKRN